VNLDETKAVLPIGGETPVEESGEATAGRRPWLRGRVRNDALFFLIAVAVLVLDQLTKYVVRSSLSLGESFPDEGFFRITHVANTGAAFGILKGQTAFLIVTTFFGLAAILLYYAYPPLEHGILRIALGLQLGGAIGNLTDRVRMGRVTDFIDVGAWPAFNVADSSIVIGVTAILAFFVLTEASRRRKLPP
jgi:signal peptidase II